MTIKELIGWDPQPTGYDKTDYGMLYFAAAGMERKGNVLSFPMQGLVVLDGGKWGVLLSGIHGKRWRCRKGFDYPGN